VVVIIFCLPLDLHSVLLELFMTSCTVGMSEFAVGLSQFFVCLAAVGEIFC
jgi:hypothetical protein